MASKNVLTEAINKLVNANIILTEKIKNYCDSKKINELKKEISKNKAMILDYKFRLEHE